jgi:hypothetical protein
MGGGMSAVTPAEVLRAAADLIEPEGKWVQGALAGDEQGRPLRAAVTGADFCGFCWCAWGSLDMATWNAAVKDQRDGAWKARDGARVALHSYLGRDVAAWNDAPERTQAEVVAALRAAADRAEQVAA